MCTARSSSHWGGSASVHAEISPPGVGLETPPGVGLENPPPGCGPGGPPQVWAWRHPWVWAWRPPQVWAWRYPPQGVSLETPSPQPDPSTSPLGVGLETPPGQTPQLPPWVWAWRPAKHAAIPPLPPETFCKACWDTTCNACWDTTPPQQNHRHV